MAASSCDTFISSLNSGNIIIHVGQGAQRTTLSVPKAFIIAKSRYFALLLSKPSFQAPHGAEDGAIDLPDASVKACKMFVTWCFKVGLR